MTEQTPTYQTEAPPMPSDAEMQEAARWYLMRQQAHEIGLMAERRLEELNALPGGKRLFLSRVERRNGKAE
jgi:hypothetical protein